MKRSLAYRALAAAAGPWLSCTGACQTEVAWNGELPNPDRAMFESTVYPILLRDCAFSECHGAPQRFFQVYGPGRTRLPGHPSDPDLVPREKAVSYQRAAAMLVAPHPSEAARAPLLTKALELAAGGAAHEGTDIFGRNAFQTTADPRYQVLLAWAFTHDAGTSQVLPVGGRAGVGGGGAPSSAGGQPLAATSGIGALVAGAGAPAVMAAGGTAGSPLGPLMGPGSTFSAPVGAAGGAPSSSAAGSGGARAQP